jgi:hypothetical protein
MTRLSAILLCIATLALASCQPEIPDPDESLAMEGPIAAVPGAAATMDIGTVETTLLVDGGLAPEMPLENIEQNVLGGMRGSTSLAMYTVTPPVPRPLWIHFTLKARETYNRPVVVRGHVFRDDVAVLPVATMIGQSVPPATFPTEFRVDALEGLDAVPDETLLILKADVFLLPEGVDPAGIDLATAEAPASDAGFVMSNPVRLLFPSPVAVP